MYQVHVSVELFWGLFISGVKWLCNTNFSWITSRRIRTWSASDYHLNENINLSSVWSWLNVLSDLHDYGNHSDFWFLRGVCVLVCVEKQAKSNELSRLHSFDIFLEDAIWKMMFCWRRGNMMTQHKWLWLVICAKSERTWLKINVFWWEWFKVNQSQRQQLLVCWAGLITSRGLISPPLPPIPSFSSLYPCKRYRGCWICRRWFYSEGQIRTNYVPQC